MKIGKKLTAMTVSIVLIGAGILITVIIFTARKEIVTLVQQEIHNLSETEAGSLETWFEEHMTIVRTIGSTMAAGSVELESGGRRAAFDMILRQVLKDYPDAAALASCWEPYALDGADDSYVDAPGSDSTGRYLSYWARTGGGGISVTALQSYDIPGDGDFYLRARDTGNETITEPYYYSIAGEDQLITTLTVPIKVGETVKGAALMDITIDEVQDRVLQITPYPGSVAAVFTGQGQITGHFMPERIGKHMLNTEAELSEEQRMAVLEAAREGQDISFTSDASGQAYYITCTPITIGDTGTPWTLMLGIPISVINAPVLRLLNLSIPIIAGMLLLIFVSVILMTRSISKPLKTMTVTFGEIGEGNLTRHLDIRSKDEIGDICRSFNDTVEKIRHLVGTIKQQTAGLYDIGGQLSTNMAETASAVNEITANIQSVQQRVINQSAGVTETRATMEQITVNIDKLNNLIEEQSVSVSRSSSAIEEMLANVQSVTQTLVNNAANVSELSGASEEGRRGLRTVADDIQGIARESAGLLEINSVMENIASQTNLLSMNAAIEAAHAGEAGKGFAVVADEIRKLAESSGEQSKTIGGILKKIKTAIDTITASTGQVLEKFEAIDASVKIVADQEENIRNAMEEQGEGSKQILDAVALLNDITLQVKTGSAEMLEGSREIIEESKSLEQVSQEISGGMNEMSSGADQINRAVNQVNEISGLNKESIDVLVREVSRFKVE